MKNKILIFLLSFTLLFSVFVISSSAEEELFEFSGYIDFSHWDETTPHPYTEIYFDFYNDISQPFHGIKSDQNGIHYYYDNRDGTFQWVRVFNVYTGKWVSGFEACSVIHTQGSPVLIDYATYSFLTDFGVLTSGYIGDYTPVTPDTPDTPDDPDTPDTPDTPTCDGSTCTAVDFNNDDVCDTCGRAFSLGATYNYNGYRLPVHPDIDSNVYRYWYIVYNETTEQGYFIGTTSYLAEKDGTVVFGNKQGGTAVRYLLVDNEWQYDITYNVVADQTAVYPSSNLTWSSHPVSTSTGELFMAGDVNFMTPLAVTILGLAAETIWKVTLPELGGMMVTLLLCGVGCLALLIILKLFGKRSLISRH